MTDRTPYFGMCISARWYDGWGVTPAQIEAMLAEANSRQSITFNAIKIAYEWDPAVTSPTDMVSKIQAWVSYFSNYYSTIYVACTSVGVISRKLTDAEIASFYSPLAAMLASYPAVKCFIGESEPEGKQDYADGTPHGNGAAYSSYTDMMNYIEKLHDAWHSYSSIPFTCPAIPPVSDEGTTITNKDCWWFVSCPSATYWNYINYVQDIYAIDEWRYHSGIPTWVNHVSSGGRGIFIGETFVPEPPGYKISDLKSLIDAFGSNMKYFFYWAILGNDTDTMYSGPKQGLTYYDYWGHNGSRAYAYLKKKVYGMYKWWDILPPTKNYAACVESWGEVSSDYAIATKSVSFYRDGSLDQQFAVLFNIDMFKAGNVAGGNEANLAAFSMADGLYYAFTAVLQSDGIHLKFYYPKTDNTMTSWTSGLLFPGVWYNAVMHFGANDNSIAMEADELLPNGTSSQKFLTYTYNARDSYTLINKVSFGAMGGNFVKLLVGEIQCLKNWNWQNPIWQETFEGVPAPCYVAGYNGWSFTYQQSSDVLTEDWINGAIRFDWGIASILVALKS